MVKMRLIFTLLFSEGVFMLSRNFKLQKVGDINWINMHYNFQDIAFSIDELIILNISRNNKKQELFCEYIRQLGDQCFIPIAAGGGISCIEDAEILLKSGGDKIVINTILQTDPCLVRNLVSLYGSQCVIGSIDFKKVKGQFKAFIKNGSEEIPILLKDYFKKVMDLGVGEIYLNSIDKDGTGQGFVMEILDLVDEARNPVIMAGGAGNSKHFLEAILHNNVSAVATANLFNFIGNGLPNARKELKKKNILLAAWDTAEEKKLYNYFC